MSRPDKSINADLQTASRGANGRRHKLTLAVIVSFVAGIFAWYGYTSAMAWTNTEHFCLSCHEMAAYPNAEFLETVHDLNPAGLHASCSDCHVPRAQWPKFLRKVAAVNDVYQHLLGTIDTPEKYRQRRLHLAQKVWDRMQSSDSRECRSCHTLEKMDFEAQSGRAARKHQSLGTSGATCIDCHKGIAHLLPDGYEPETT